MISNASHISNYGKIQNVADVLECRGYFKMQQYTV